MESNYSWMLTANTMRKKVEGFLKEGDEPRLRGRRMRAENDTFAKLMSIESETSAQEYSISMNGFQADASCGSGRRRSH